MGVSLYRALLVIVITLALILSEIRAYWKILTKREPSIFI